MFVQNLNQKQQSALLFLAQEVIKADGNLHTLQLSMLSILQQQMVEDVKEKAIAKEELDVIFDTEKSKCSLLLELIGIAHANDEYHQDEKELIRQYAQALKVSKEKLDALEDWVERQLSLSKEAEALLQ